MYNVTAVRRKNKEYQSPSVGPHQKPEKQESVEEGDRTEKWRKGRKKKPAERKKGYNFSCVINFQSQVRHSFSLNAVFPLAAGHRLF